MTIALFGIFFFVIAGASAIYALVITNQTNTNVVLSYGIWGDTSFDLTSDLESATGPIAWSTTGLPPNVSAVFTNASDSGATLTLNQLNNGPNAGNYQMYVVATAQSGESTNTMIAITVQQRAFSIRGSFTANNKTYNRSAAATIATNSLTPGVIDVMDGDDVTLVPVVTFANANAGVGKTVSISNASTLTGAQAANYYITLSGAPTTAATISQQPVSITPPTFTKTYDKTNTATAVGTPALNGILSGDTVTISGTPTFTYNQTSVGTGIGITPSVAYGLSGATASNYSLTQPTLTGDITRRSLSITFTGTNKTYDGSTAASILVAADTRIAGDVLGTISATTSSFTQGNIGTGLTINISGISGSGVDAGNYTFPTTATTTADITARTLTIGGTLQVPSTRVYDKTVTATISNTATLTIVNAISADVSNLSLSGLVAQFANKTVGTNKPVTLTAATLDGTARNNYTLSLSGAPTATANITAKTLNVTISATDKQYDTNNTASVTFTDDHIAGDVVSASGTATFDTKAIGSGKTVTATGITLSGTDATNYTSNTSATTTANITARTLTIGITGGGKVYDGNTTAAVTYTDNRLSGDSISISGTATYATKTAGAGKTINATGITVTGTDAGNYTYSTTASGTATITTRTLTVQISSTGKTYDRTTSAVVTYTDNRVSGDVISITGSAAYADKTAAAGKTITATGINVTGTDAANYTYNSTATTTATISKRTLNVTITFAGKIYDASTAAAVTYVDDRITNDVLTITGTANYDTKNIGTGKTITATGITVTNTDSANYIANTSATVTANITARALTITGTYTPSNKVYDSTTTATVTPPASPTLATIQGTDSVSLSGTPSYTFAQAGVGTAISITTSGYTLTGTNAGNYTLTLPTLSANITTRALTISGTLSVNATKVYDGTLAATFANSALLTLANVASGDSGNSAKLAIASPVAQYATKGVGTSKPVSLTSASLSGTSAGNYTLSVAGAPTATANITAKALAVTATGVNKTYDGLLTATITLSSDKLAGDTVTLAYSGASFTTKIAENGKTVNVTGISISGTDATNYSANTTTSTTANITVRSLTVSFTATSKVYDATTAVTVVYTSNKVAGDTVTISGSAAFATKAAGVSKQVNATSIVISGADAANYTANTTALAYANITAKPLAVTITAANKVYNGTTAASVTYTDDRITGDDVAVSGTPTFDTAAVGNGKTVIASGITLGGIDGGNYTPNTSATAIANITLRTLNVTISSGGKTYDATTAATVTYTSDKVPADTITITGNATYADKTAAAGKTITATGIAISGASSSNYVLGNTTASTTATITKRVLTITGTFTANSRPYDGTTDATGNVTVPQTPGVSPVQGSDDVTLTGTPVFTYASSSVANGISIAGSGYSISGSDTANYTLTQLTLSSNITLRVVTIGGSLVVPSTRTYDSTTATTITDLSALTIVNVPAADAGNSSKLALTGLVAQYASKTVGSNKSVSITSASLTGSTSSNYSLSMTGAPTTTANITLRSLLVTITATSRIYNANTSVIVSYADNRVSGDVFTVSGAASFDTKNYGTGKTVTANNITLTGADATNYSQNSTATTTADITRRPLTVTGTFTVANRQYDATTNATAQITLPALAGLSDVQAGDDATLTGTPVFTFAQATIGNSIAISTTGYSVTGVDAANYLLTQPSFAANITQRPLTIGGTLSVTSTKVYNRSTAAAITDASLLNLINVPAGDANNPAKVALTSLTATYDTKNVGSGKTVSVATAALTGTTSGNYTITTVGAPTTTAEITQKPITLGFTLSNKTYDANTSASVTFTDTRIAGDTLTVSGTPTYPDKNVGTNKTVTATNMSITGTDAANYSFNTTATATASILAKSLTVTFTADNKVYDGIANATVTYSDNRIAGDLFVVSGTATFANKNYGLGKVVTANSITLTGTDASNYSQNTTQTASANITKRPLAVTITAANKIYNQTAVASVTYFDDRVPGDNFVITSTPTFSDKNVGTSKLVTANSIALSGTDANNYTPNTSTTARADITKRSLTIGITPSNKVYNANDIAIVSYTDNRITGDVLSFASTATFSDKNIGTAKTVTAVSIVLSNTDAGNYDYNTTASSTANITKRPLTVTGTFTVANRQYDATTDATAQVTLPATAGLSDVQSGDDATLTGTPTFTFAQANVANSIAITTTGYSVVGVDANNYALTQPGFTANITQRPLTIGGALVVSSSKVYDKGVSATITDTTQLLLQNVPTGDANNAAKVGLTSLAASYNDKNVGTSKPVTLTTASLSGTTSTNYTLSLTGAPSTTADITRKSVTITISPVGKTYDGNTNAGVTYSDNRISGDVITASGTPTFSDKNVGVSKTVTAVGISLSGADSGNYTPNSTATSTATITQRSLSVTTSGVNKVYDRTVNATVTFTDNRVSGDVFSYSSTSTFNTKTVGTAKPISTTGITLSGTDSGNYVPNTTASSFANITLRPLAVTMTASNKTYNGNTSVSVAYSDDRVSGDLFTVTGSASFDNKNIGTAKTVTATSISISGTDASNYSQNTSTTTTANVTARPLVITAVADDKVYDATVAATATYSDDRVSSDVFTVTGVATFSSKTAAAGKTVSIANITITGTDANNYVQNTTTTSTAGISQRPLEVTGTLQAQDKVYDGLRTATYDIADLTLVGVQGTDAVGVTNPRGRFRTDANVGVNKIVELTSFQFTGADLGNYAVSVNNSPITYATITPRTLAVTMTAANKTYDGNTSATATYFDNRVAGDVMTVSGNATFSDKNVGTGKTVTANNITLSGTASGNYSQNTSTTTTANVTVRTLAVTITAANKTYDGNTSATATYLDNRVGGDDITVSGNATFASKVVGNAKTVTASSIQLTGTDSGNYVSNTSTTATANITLRSLTVTISATNKVYDKNTSVSVAYGDNRVSGDVFTVSGTPAFNDKNVGTGKTVTATSITLLGTDAANYTQNTSATTTADITARSLTVTITATSKVYNANTSASVTYSDNRISGDTFLVSGTANFDDKTAANGKTVTAIGIVLTGTDANNYSPNTSATTTANITKRTLTVTGTFTVAHRQYDATTDATSQITLPNVAGLSDVQAGDDTSLAGTPTFTFAQATVGTNIGITSAGYSLIGADAANYSLTSPTFTANITHRPLTITGSLVTASTKTYDRTAAISITDVSALSLNNVPGGDANAPSKVALTNVVAQYADKAVATSKLVTVTSASLAGTTAGNYTLSVSGAPTTTADITARSLVVTISATNKTYDATDSVAVTYLDNRIAGDILTVTGAATFNNKNVGNGKTVTANSIAITGTDAANYTQNTSATTTANITAKTLAVTITATNKTYDGNTTASVIYTDNRVPGDVLTVSGNATFNNKNVGNGKTVTANSIAITGTDAANYTQNTSATTTANITAKTLAVTITATNKTYDGNTAAAVTYSDDRIAGDVFTVSGVATFANKNVGDGKTVTASSIVLTGTDAANYTQNTTATTTANITARSLTVTITATNKTYDGNTAATVTYSDDRIAGDSLTVSGVATYNNKNVGTAKTVTATSIAITGTDAANYTQNTSATTTANITAKTLAVTITANNKTYDGNTAATVAYSDDRIAGDVFTVSGVATFANKNVGDGKIVTASSIVLAGTDSGNYAQNTSTMTTANIALRSLTVTITATNKTYDANTSASVTYLDNRVTNDVLTVSGNATFNNKNVGNAKTITATSIAITGTDAANYIQNTTATTTANITAKTLAVTITATNKTYDGNTAATVTYSDDRIAGDVLTVSGTSTFSNKTVSDGKTVTASSIAITGTDAANYTQNTSATTTANITRRALAVTITATNKTYDGNTTAAVTYLDDRINGDVLSISGTSTFSDKTVSDGKTVTASSIAITGTDAANYTQNTTATTTANITPKTLTVTITANNKTYDANTNASVTYLDNRVPGDVLTVSGNATYNNKNVGTAKTVTATSIAITGTDADNYTQNTSATTTANITRRPLTVTVIADDKTYDATNIATVTYTDNRLPGDTFSISSTALFNDDELGRDKPVAITNITLIGTDANNYSSNSTASSVGDITVREITAEIPVFASSTALSDATPTVLVGALVPNIDTTVTFSRTGFPSVVCSFVPQLVTEPCTATTLADGTWTYRARQLIAGLMVASSGQLTITIDTTAPLATKAVSFATKSDTGISPVDGITSDTTPTVSVVEASPTDRVEVTASANGQLIQCSFTVTATENSCTLPSLSDGTWAVSALITDSANNTSDPTPSFTALIDTITPKAGVAPFNAQDNGSGTSLVATPKISVADVTVGEIATINALSSKGDKASCSFTASATVNYCVMSTMVSGTWNMVSVISDQAGNTSPESAPTQIIISAGIAPMKVPRTAVTPTPSKNKSEKLVEVKFGTSAAISGVQSVSFIVLDGSGKVVRRSTIKVSPNATSASIVVPASIKGAKVRVITTNQCGVSEGAPKSFNVRKGKTSISIDQKTNNPKLSGQLVLPNINFAPSEVTLDSADKARLDKALKEMKGKCGTLLVTGFARHSKIASKRYLQNLAEFRAQAVADYLSGKGLTMWIEYQGFVVKSDDINSDEFRRADLYWTPA